MCEVNEVTHLASYSDLPLTTLVATLTLKTVIVVGEVRVVKVVIPFLYINIIYYICVYVAE